jgi:hypothetical protein
VNRLAAVAFLVLGALALMGHTGLE